MFVEIPRGSRSKHEIETFFRTYKTIETRAPDVRGWHGAAAAWKLIDEARARARRA